MDRGLLIILPSPRIPSKNGKADGDRSEYRNDDDPGDGLVDFFCAGGVDVEEGAVDENDDKGGSQQHPYNSQVALYLVHDNEL